MDGLVSSTNIHLLSKERGEELKPFKFSVILLMLMDVEISYPSSTSLSSDSFTLGRIPVYHSGRIVEQDVYGALFILRILFPIFCYINQCTRALVYHVY